MGSKAEYEARKKQRIEDMKAREEHWQQVSQLDEVIREKTSILELLKMTDRFVSAVERLADALDD